MMVGFIALIKVVLFKVKMNRERIKLFLSAITNAPVIDDGGDWIKTHCPLAFKTHQNGTDNSPSFGVSVNPDSDSVYYCFTCSEQAKPIYKLLHNLWVMSGEYPREAGKVLAGSICVKEIEDSYAYRDVWKKYEEPVEVAPIDDIVFEDFRLVYGSINPYAYTIQNYLNGRGITSETIKYFGIRFWNNNGSITFPYTLLDKKIYSLRQRHIEIKLIYSITSEMVGRKDLKFYTPKQTGVWFGLEKANMKYPVILVEGELDVMRLNSLGINNAIGSGTSNATKKQLSMLTCSSVYLGYDADEAGTKAKNKISKYLSGKVNLMELDWSIAKKQSGEPCKDACDVPNRTELAVVFKAATEIKEIGLLGN